MVKLSDQEFDELSEYIYNVSGISLDKNKEYLIETRLNPLLDKCDCGSFNELLKKAKQDSSKEIEKHIISAISTNETLFFRDEKPFNLLENKLIPEIIDKKSEVYSGKIPIKIWSAGCSYGQEVYSIIITLLEMLPNPDKYEIDVLGTDISHNAIEKASYGKYSKFEIERGLSDKYRRKYFHKQEDGWRINDKVRMYARFKILNLLDPLPNLSPFDIIFCRNVAIYFSHGDKIRLFNNLSKVLKQNGYLILGGSESLTNISTPFTPQHYLRTTFYTLRGDSREYTQTTSQKKSSRSYNTGRRRKSNIFKKVKQRRRKQSKKVFTASETEKSTKVKKQKKFSSKSNSQKRQSNRSSKIDKTEKPTNDKNKSQKTKSSLLKNSDSKEKKDETNTLEKMDKEQEETKETTATSEKEGKENTRSLLSTIHQRAKNTTKERSPSSKGSLLNKLEE